MGSLRIYADTSVFGGGFDDEFEVESRRFFSLVHGRLVTVLLSEFVLEELELAPARVQRVLEELPRPYVHRVEINTDVIELRNAFLASKVVGPRSTYDATHVAAATVGRCDAIVSWNFQHIVRLDKIRMYNGVSIQRGYPPVSIVTPKEVRFDEEERA